MKRLTLLVLVSVLLGGCTTFQPSIPEGYTGPVATIKDSEKRIDGGKADMFYLSHIDGKKIRSSHIATIEASHGLGNTLKTVLLENEVPIGSHVFSVVGKTVYAMPIRALSGTVYEVEGDMELSPLTNGQYIVKGILSEGKCAVWVENISTGEIIKKIEVEGSCKLGFFEK